MKEDPVPSPFMEIPEPRKQFSDVYKARLLIFIEGIDGFRQVIFTREQLEILGGCIYELIGSGHGDTIFFKTGDKVLDSDIFLGIYETEDDRNTNSN